jgi:hypothetical protein
VKIEVPQITHFRFHERFRWRADQVLLLSLGVVATPSPGQKTGLGISVPFTSSAPRADLLILVESRGKLPVAPQMTRGVPPAGVGPYGR